MHTEFWRGRWSGIPMSFRIFQFIVIATVKGFGVVNKAEIDVFLGISCFFNAPKNVGNLISGSSAFSKPSLDIWKFMDHVVLKPGLENFEHYFASVWDECNCVVVLAFFVIAFLWDWNESWPFPKTHLTSHSRISGSRWVITPSWLPGSWRSFLYSSSVYFHSFLSSHYHL